MFAGSDGKFPGYCRMILFSWKNHVVLYDRNPTAENGRCYDSVLSSKKFEKVYLE
jgi:hypothetical protein